jgi:hypothetical protein
LGVGKQSGIGGKAFSKYKIQTRRKGVKERKKTLKRTDLCIIIGKGTNA